MDPDVRFAVSMSHLRELPSDLLDQLMNGAERVKVPAGSVTHWEGDDSRHIELVISGMVRAFVTAENGRTMTIRYCRPGALIGALSLFTARFTMPGTTQALVDAELLRLSAAVVRRAADRDTRVAGAFLRELSERAQSFIYEIPGSAFATVRQRVGRHLLDLASERGPQHPSNPTGAKLTVRVSQQDLADAVGTVREVVVRVLRALRQDGVVRTERDRIVILDPGRLIEEQGWNTSS